jgi:ribose transport system substrate-binding protein
MKKSLFAAALLSAVAFSSAPSFAEEIYFPIIAKGFSHQFWQAVKLGAETAAKANGVTISFEAPNRYVERCNRQEATRPRLCCS